MWTLPLGGRGHQAKQAPAVAFRHHQLDQAGPPRAGHLTFAGGMGIWQQQSRATVIFPVGAFFRPSGCPQSPATSRLVVPNPATGLVPDVLTEVWPVHISRTFGHSSKWPSGEYPSVFRDAV